MDSDFDAFSNVLAGRGDPALSAPGSAHGCRREPAQGNRLKIGKEFIWIKNRENLREWKV